MRKKYFCRVVGTIYLTCIETVIIYHHNHLTYLKIERQIADANFLATNIFLTYRSSEKNNKQNSRREMPLSDKYGR